MANYYVRTTGSDGNAGTSSGAAWQTINHALGNVSAGDNIYVGAGVYRETVLCAYTDGGSAVTVVGDVDGSHTGDVGEVQLTAFTTDNKTAPAATVLLDLNGKINISFSNFVFVGGSVSLLADTIGTSHGITLTDCTFFHFANAISLYFPSYGPDFALNLTINRCRFFTFNTSSNDVLFVNGVASATAFYDSGIVIENSIFWCPSCNNVIDLQSSGAGGGSFAACGGVIKNNTFVTATTAGYVFNCNSWVSTGSPATQFNNNLVYAVNGVSAANVGDTVEDYNLFNCLGTVLTNVTQGGNTIADNSYAPLINIGQELQEGRLLRPWGMPTIDSPILGFGNDGSYTVSVDVLNRPRPSGGAITWATNNKAVGAYERHDFGQKETTTYDSSPNSLRILGTGDQDLYIPVDAVATNVSILVRWDGNYGGGTKPQITLVANGEIGVTTQTVTAAGSANTFNTVSLSPFTPSGSGWVTLRLISNAAATGYVYWDTLSVT